MAKRFRIVAVLEGDLDALPGMCHQETDWQQIAFRDFLAQTHYNTSVTILESTDHRDIMGGYASIFDGWIEHDEPTMPHGVKPDDMVQVRTTKMPNGYLNEWIPAELVWNSAQRAEVVTHYRVKRAAYSPAVKLINARTVATFKENAVPYSPPLAPPGQVLSLAESLSMALENWRMGFSDAPAALAWIKDNVIGVGPVTNVHKDSPAWRETAGQLPHNRQEEPLYAEEDDYSSPLDENVYRPCGCPDNGKPHSNMCGEQV